MWLFSRIRADQTLCLTSPFYLFYIAKQMKRGELLGSLEHIILLALARLDGWRAWNDRAPGD